MTSAVAEKLNGIFTQEFIDANVDIDSTDKLYEKVYEIDSSICKEDYEEYIGYISSQMHKDELEEGDLEPVAGGFGWVTLGAVLAGIAAATKVISFCYNAGKAVGEAIYNARH